MVEKRKHSPYLYMIIMRKCIQLDYLHSRQRLIWKADRNSMELSPIRLQVPLHGEKSTNHFLKMGMVHIIKQLICHTLAHLKISKPEETKKEIKNIPSYRKICYTFAREEYRE